MSSIGFASEKSKLRYVLTLSQIKSLCFDVHIMMLHWKVKTGVLALYRILGSCL